jgi:hypothetical protein
LEVLEGGGREFSIVKKGSAPGSAWKLAKSKLAGEPTLGSHGFTHRHAMNMGPVANERAHQTVYSIKWRGFFKWFLDALVQGEKGLQRDLQPETTKLQSGKSRILSHGSTHRHAIDMRLTANERAHQTIYSIRRLNFFKVILAIRYKGMCKNRPIFQVFGSRIQLQTCYGHGE